MVRSTNLRFGGERASVVVLWTDGRTGTRFELGQSHVSWVIDSERKKKDINDEQERVG